MTTKTSATTEHWWSCVVRVTLSHCWRAHDAVELLCRMKWQYLHIITITTFIVNFTHTLKHVLWKIKENFKKLLEHETYTTRMYRWVACRGCLLIYAWVPPKFISIAVSLFTWFHSEGMNSFWSFCLWWRKLNSNRLQSQKKLPSVRAASNC